MLELFLAGADDVTIAERVRTLRYAPWFEPILEAHPKASIQVRWHRSGKTVPGAMTLKTAKDFVAEGKIVVSLDNGDGLLKDLAYNDNIGHGHSARVV
jgi:hypothetical protein